MSESIMTSRERWLAALRREPVDRLPFWPKIGGGYRQHQAEPYRSMDDFEIHRYVGSDRHVSGPPCTRVVRRRTQVDVTRESTLQRTVYTTPHGTLTMVDRYDRASAAWHPIEFPVKTRRDIALLTEIYEDTRYEFAPESYEKAVAIDREAGSDALTVTNMGTSPLMDWLQHLAGIENGHFFLADHREEVEALFRAMHAGLVRRTEIIAERAPFPAIYSTENTSTSLISPDLFARYCAGHLADYGRAIGAAGKMHILHMCGKLHRLLSAIGALGATAIEAYTTSPVGDASLLDGRTAAPAMCFIGGTNATDWMEPTDAIIAQIKSNLSPLPHHRGIVVTSAGVMPPACRPETIRAVADWIKAYPARA